MDTLYPDRTWQRERATIASLTVTQADPERLTESRRVLAYLKAAERLQSLVESEPRLTPVERASLAAILLGGAA